MDYNDYIIETYRKVTAPTTTGLYYSSYDYTLLAQLNKIPIYQVVEKDS